MINISQATPNDFSEIYALDQSIAKYCYHSEVLIDSALAWRTWIESGLIYKAVSDSQEIIGVVVAFYVKKHGWCIHKVLVSNDYLQENLALELLQKQLTTIDHREDKAYVVVHPHDLYAIKLYNLLGFSQQKLYPDYLGDKEDRFILTRPVSWSDTGKSRNNRKNKAIDNPWNVPKVLSDPDYSGNNYINSMSAT